MSGRFGPFGESRDASMDKLTIEHLSCQRDTAIEQLEVAIDALTTQLEHNKGLLNRLRDASHLNTRLGQENHSLRQELDEAGAALAELKKASDS